jgi:hypothetical protein
MIVAAWCSSSIMSDTQLEKLDGDLKGIMQIYVNEEKHKNVLPELMKLSGEYGYKVNDIKHSFETNETNAQTKSNLEGICNCLSISNIMFDIVKQKRLISLKHLEPLCTLCKVGKPYSTDS